MKQIIDLFTRWIAARQERETLRWFLARHDAHLLRDIGLDRGDASDALMTLRPFGPEQDRGETDHQDRVAPQGRPDVEASGYRRRAASG